MTKTLTNSDLNQFTGTEHLYRHSLVRHVVYTDGARHVAVSGEAYWLLDKIACAQLEPNIASQPFQHWTLKVHDNRSADLICTDGDSGIVSTEHLSFTDFPLSEISFYVVGRTILLPSEY